MTGGYPSDVRSRALALWQSRPETIIPMQPIAAEPRALGGSWLWEPLVSGTRCLGWVTGGRARLHGADGTSLDRRFGRVAAQLGSVARGDAIFDGVIGPTGYDIFDCLHYEGAALSTLPLSDRRSVLRDALLHDERIRRLPSFRSLEEIVRLGFARGGVIAKRAASAYTAGPSSNWLAMDCARRDDFVIGGYVATPRSVAPEALLLGYYDGGRLRYAGRVSHAYDPAALEALAPLLRRLTRRTTPFNGATPTGRDVHWVSPGLVARVGFAEWTAAGLVQRARLVGLRHDRAADEVRRVEASR